VPAAHGAAGWRPRTLLDWLVVGVAIWIVILGLEAWAVPDDRHVGDLLMVALICGIPSGWFMWALGNALENLSRWIDSFRPRR
jgi:hypothetical protein